MSDSILTSTKRILGIEEADTAFDLDIITHINTVFTTLDQLGVGPDGGFMIEDKTPTWGGLLGSSPRYNAVKTYVYLRVRALFDPPQTGYAVEAIEKQIEQLEWRLSVNREMTDWEDPDPDPVEPDPGDILDGGNP